MTDTVARNPTHLRPYDRGTRITPEFAAFMEDMGRIEELLRDGAYAAIVEAISITLTRLADSTANMEQARNHVLDRRIGRESAQYVYDRTRSALLLDPAGPIDGKNEATRKAQLEAALIQEQADLDAATNQHTRALIHLEHCEADLSRDRRLSDMVQAVIVRGREHD